jgi:hypothetical protein
MGCKAPRKSPLLAAKKSVGGDLEIIQDVTQVLFAAAVQIGLNSIGNPGSKSLAWALLMFSLKT